MRRLLTTWAVLVAVATVTVALPLVALAHPQGNSTTNRYVRIEVYQDTFVLHDVLDLAEVPTIFWEMATDLDGDGELSDAELAVYMDGAKAEIREQLVLTVDGEPLELRFEDYAITHAPGDIGLPVLRVDTVWTAQAPAGLAGEAWVHLAVAGHTYEPGWRVIVVAPSEGAVVDVAPGYLDDKSEALSVFPEIWSTFPPRDTEVRFGWVGGTGSSLEHAPRATPPGTRMAEPGRGGLESLFAREAGAGFMVAALALAFLFGIVEALGPGHAKTAVAAYIGSSRAGYRDALIVSAVAASSHSLVVFAIGGLLLGGSALFLRDDSQAWIPLLSGVMIMGVGAMLIARNRRGHVHRHAVGSKNALIGVAGGVVPCPSSILVMVAAVALGEIAWGVLLILAFSLGTATVLLAIGAALVSGRERARRVIEGRQLEHAVRFLPAAGGMLVVVAGAWVVLRGLADVA